MPMNRVEEKSLIDLADDLMISVRDRVKAANDPKVAGTIRLVSESDRAILDFCQTVYLRKLAMKDG